MRDIASVFSAASYRAERWYFILEPVSSSEAVGHFVSVGDKVHL